MVSFVLTSRLLLSKVCCYEAFCMSVIMWSLFFRHDNDCSVTYNVVWLYGNFEQFFT